jgi:hypothetical protein
MYLTENKLDLSFDGITLGYCGQGSTNFNFFLKESNKNCQNAFDPHFTMRTTSIFTLKNTLAE